MKFGAFLVSLVGPIVARLLAVLGFSIVTIVGMESVVGQLKAQIITNVNSLPADMLNIALYLGIGTGIGIIFGAIATKMSLWAIENSTKLLGKSNG